METLVKKYEETINHNLKDIKSILKKDIGIKGGKINKEVEKIMRIAHQNLASKWMTGKKYMRTFYVKKAFPQYPEDSLNLSISLDVTINILDDILDENLSKEIKALYLVELIRTLSVYNKQKSSNKLKRNISNYFNKIISIAVLEGVYHQMIKAEVNEEKIVNYCMQIYDCRSLDMDIYAQIPFIVLKENKKNINKIVKIARIFRAVNLIKKDIDDLEHDKQNGIETAIILLIEKGNAHNYLNKIIDLYVEKSKKINEQKNIEAINNFKKMIEEEHSKVSSLLKSIRG
ncbi:MAG: hypothetical protein AB1467_01515 [Candidatus Diapherotrites archaeon]